MTMWHSGPGRMAQWATYGVDGLVAEILQEAGFPIVVESRWIESVYQALHCGIGHGADLVYQRWAKRSQGAQDTFPFFESPAVANGDGGYRVTCRRGHEHCPGSQLVGFRPGELAVEPQDVFRLLVGVDDHPCQYRTNTMQPILEGGPDTKIPT